MKVTCDYCGAVFEDTVDRCPSCGASNPKRNVADKKPRTIDELEQWYRDRNLPPSEVTRFFIGLNYTEPKAFGIYKNELGDFVVYKNKADGSRAIRYEGKDEEYAVNELYQKLKDEIVNQKYLNQHNYSGSSGRTVKNLVDSNGVLNPTGWFLILFFAFFFGGGFLTLPVVLVVLFIWQSCKVTDEKKKKRYRRLGIGIGSVTTLCIALIIALFVTNIPRHTTGYYTNNNHYYYYDSHISQWYEYDSDYDYWNHTDTPSFYVDNKSSKDLDYYYMGETYGSWNTNATDFSDINSTNSTHYSDIQSYEDTHSSSSYDSYDSSYDWDSGDSWDSGGSDWDSDW